jgi:hypothetical protein
MQKRMFAYLGGAILYLQASTPGVVVCPIGGIGLSAIGSALCCAVIGGHHHLMCPAR